MAAYEIRDYWLVLGVVQVCGRVAVIPNCFANLLSEFQVSLGLDVVNITQEGNSGRLGFR